MFPQPQEDRPEVVLANRKPGPLRQEMIARAEQLGSFLKDNCWKIFAQVFLCSCPSTRLLTRPRPHDVLGSSPGEIVTLKFSGVGRGVVFLIIASVIPRCVARFRLRMWRRAICFLRCTLAPLAISTSPSLPPALFLSVSLSA